MSTIEKTRELALKELKKVIDLNSLKAFETKFFGKNGLILKLFSEIKNIDPAKRGEYGKSANELKVLIEQQLAKLRSELEIKQYKEVEAIRDIDLNAPFNINTTELPGYLGEIGNLHPLTIELDNILSTFRSMGFTVFEGRELDTDYYMFEVLGLPKNHPAREAWDTFYTEERFIPTAHTSNMQVRILRELKTPPIRAVMYSKCFRNEALDAVHGHTFYQVEGIYVDKGVNVGNMIATIKSYLESFFERKITWRIQPGYFPFVEPGIEFLIKCIFCEGMGCASCKNSGWLELMGAGMIHPNVLENGRIPKGYTGFAWGFGFDRMVMNKNNIRDIRMLQGSDLRLFRIK